MNQKSLIIGICVTVVWFLGITIFCILGNFGFEQKNLNSLGDFLAGIFAPVAFFWLILGYVQQGKQLEQNTKALEQQDKALQLQIREMQASLIEQKEITRLQKQRFEIEINNLKPIVSVLPKSIRRFDTSKVISGSGPILYTVELTLQNEGRGYATDISLIIENNPYSFTYRGQAGINLIQKMNVDEKVDISFLISDTKLDFQNPNYHLSFILKYKDINAVTYESSYCLWIDYKDKDEKIDLEVYTLESISDE